jgi:hypothetical protein
MAEGIGVSFQVAGIEDVLTAFKEIQKESSKTASTAAPAGEGMTSAFSGILGVASQVGMVLSGIKAGFDMVWGVAQKFGGVVMDLIGTAGAAENLSRGFEGLSKRIGETGSTLLPKLRTALQGTVSDMSIMQMANYAMQVGLPVTGDQMAELANVARQLGQNIGLGPTESFHYLTMGLARQNNMMLRHIGLVVDTNKVYGDLAKSLNKSVTDLSEAEKQQAFLNAVMTQGKETVKSMGEDTMGASEKLASISAAFENLKEKIGSVIASSPGFDRLFKTIIGLVEQAGAWVTANSETIASFFNQLFDLVGALANLFLTVLLPAIQVVIGLVESIMASPFFSVIKWLFGGGGGTPAAPGIPEIGAPEVKTEFNIKPAINVAITQTGTATEAAIDTAFAEAKTEVLSKLAGTEDEIRRQGQMFETEVKNRLYR